MAIEHISTILCDYLVHADNGRFTLVGMFTNISGPTLPITKQPIGVYIELVGEPGEPYRISIEGNGLDVLISEGVINQRGTPLQFQQSRTAIAGEMGLRFDTYGQFNVVLRSGAEIIHSTPFGVIQVVTGDVEEEDAA